MRESQLQLDADSFLPPFRMSAKHFIHALQNLDRFCKLRFEVESFCFRQRVLYFIAGGPARAAEQNNQQQRDDTSCHDPPLRKDDLNRGFLSSDPIPLRREFGILENQYAANWNPNAAHGRLPEKLQLRAVNENIGP